MNPALTAYLLTLAAHLKNQMKSDDYPTRSQGLPEQILKTKCPSIERALASAIMNLEKDNLKFIHATCHNDATSRDMLNEFQQQLNALILKAVEFQVVAQGSIVNYLNGVGACQEHTVIATYFLMKMIQTYDFGITGIEAVHLDVPETGNHAFIVINRDLAGDLKNISTWGTDCLVFDPFMQWVTSSQQLPTDSILYEYANKTTIIGNQVIMSSHFSSIKVLDGLKVFAKSHALYPTQQRANAKLREHMLEFMNSIHIEDRFPITLQFPFTTPINEQLESLLLQDSTAKPIQCSTAKKLQQTTGIFFQTYLDSRYYAQVISEPLNEQAETKVRELLATDARTNFVKLGGTTRCMLTNVNAKTFPPIAKARLRYS